MRATLMRTPLLRSRPLSLTTRSGHWQTMTGRRGSERDTRQPWGKGRGHRGRGSRGRCRKGEMCSRELAVGGVEDTGRSVLEIHWGLGDKALHGPGHTVWSGIVCSLTSCNEGGGACTPSLTMPYPFPCCNVWLFWPGSGPTSMHVTGIEVGGSLALHIIPHTASVSILPLCEE